MAISAVTRSNRKRFGAVLATLVLSALLTSCASSGGSDSSNGDFKLALAVDLTGGFAVFDQPAVDGIKLAVKEINAKGGLLGKHKIVLDIKDVQSDVAQSVIDTKALLQDKPNLIAVACQTETALASGRLAQKAAIPAISTCATSPSLTSSVGNYMFGNFSADNFESTAAAEYARSKGYTNAFLIQSSDSAYTANIPKYFGEVFTKDGGKVAGTADFSLTQSDFNVIVTKIKNLSPQPDVIETGMFEPAFPAFMKQLRGAGVTTPVIGAGGIDTPSVVALGSAVSNLVFASQGYATPGSKLATFNDKIAKAYGKENVTSYAARGYDLVLNIEAAVKKANSIDPAKVRDALASLKDVPGVDATTTYDYPGSNGLPLLKPLYFVTVDNGAKKLVYKATIDPTTVPKAQN